MTLEEIKDAVEVIKAYRQRLTDSVSNQIDGDIKAFDLAVEAMEREQKTGHWIEIAKYRDGMHEIECSECGSHIFDRGHANSYVVKEKYKYCPNCGCRMFEPQESEG